jgi:hypothetical protein
LRKDFYLPEYHEFDHIAIAPWPVASSIIQIDWVDAVDTIERWLEQYTGPHLKEWAFTTHQEQNYWEACIAFKRERNKTLFLLQWAR